jgi:UDP-N-acetylmuramoylalanine--D-glutamate ligase
MNVEATRRALLSLQGGKWSGANVWLIAGGRDKGLAYHDLGPLIAQRVKHAFLIGEAQKKLQAAWGLFTPCTAVQTLLEAVLKAAAEAQAGDVVLLSPACSSLDMFQNYQHRGEMFRQAVELGRGTAFSPVSLTGTDDAAGKTLKFAP